MLKVFFCYHDGMEEVISTGLKDKTGRSIHVDDIIQYRLSDGGTKLRVIKHGKKFRILGEYEDSEKNVGILLTKTFCEFSVVLRCDHMQR